MDAQKKEEVERKFQAYVNKLQNESYYSGYFDGILVGAAAVGVIVGIYLLAGNDYDEKIKKLFH